MSIPRLDLGSSGLLFYSFLDGFYYGKLFQSLLQNAKKPKARGYFLLVEIIEENLECTTVLLKIYKVFSQREYSLFHFFFKTPISQTPSD